MSQTTTITLLPQTVVSVVGEKFPAACYYVSGKTMHTLSWKLTNFLGVIKFEASLADNPTVDSDWFIIYNLVCTTLNGNGGSSPIVPVLSFYNVEGNYTWIRASSTYTNGTVNYIKVSY
jgi:hypothetical protein